MYIYVKFPSGNLNFSPYHPHLTSTYNCEVTIAHPWCSGLSIFPLMNYGCYLLL